MTQNDAPPSSEMLAGALAAAPVEMPTETPATETPATEIPATVGRPGAAWRAWPGGMTAVLTAKLAASIFCVLILATVLLVTLVSAKYRTMLLEQYRSRVTVVVLDIKSELETMLSIGLPLAAIYDADAVVDRAAHLDPVVRDVVLLDREGAALYRYPGAAAGLDEREAAAFGRAVDTNASRAWTVTGDDAFTVGAVIDNTFNRAVGGLAIRYARAPVEARTWGLVTALVTRSLILDGIALVVALVLLVLAVRRLSRYARRVMIGLERALAPGGADAALPLAPFVDEDDRTLGDFLAELKGAATAVRGLERKLLP